MSKSVRIEATNCLGSPSNVDLERAKRDKNLQITIQQSLRGRSVNNSKMKWTKNEPLRQPGKLNSTFLCDGCNICIPRKDIQIHFNDKSHLERCKFLESVRESKMASMGLSAPELSSAKPGDTSKYCSVCRIHFTGTVIQHRQTPEHKGLKAMARPFCALCSQFFKSPAKYVRHCNSLAHKQHLVKSTAEHCEKLDVPAVKSKELTDEPQKCVIGTSSIVPVKGFYCKLCHKFFFTRKTAIDQHCRNAIHLKNFKVLCAVLFT